MFITVPSAPPSNLGISVLDSQSLLVFWLEVPSMHQNGIIQGYGLKYWDVNNGTSHVVTLGEYDFSYVLKPLQKATAYEINVWAFTSVGPGSVGSVNAMTYTDGKRSDFFFLLPFCPQAPLHFILKARENSWRESPHALRSTTERRLEANQPIML